MQQLLGVLPGHRVLHVRRVTYRTARLEEEDEAAVAHRHAVGQVLSDKPKGVVNVTVLPQ